MPAAKVTVPKAQPPSVPPGTRLSHGVRVKVRFRMKDVGLGV